MATDRRRRSACARSANLLFAGGQQEYLRRLCPSRNAAAGSDPLQLGHSVGTCYRATEDEHTSARRVRPTANSATCYTACAADHQRPRSELASVYSAAAGYLHRDRPALITAGLRYLYADHANTRKHCRRTSQPAYTATQDADLQRVTARPGTSRPELVHRNAAMANGTTHRWSRIRHLQKPKQPRKKEPVTCESF